MKAVTEILTAIDQGQARAAELLPLVYERTEDVLHQVASHHAGDVRESVRVLFVRGLEPQETTTTSGA